MVSDSGLGELPDAELVALAERRESRQRAMTAIYERYERRVLRFCASELREKEHALDAAHDAFAELTAHFVGGRTLKDPEALGAYLHTIARRKCMKYMRGGTPGKGHRAGLDALVLGNVPEPAAGDSGLLEAEDDLGLELVRQLLDHQVVPSLNPRHQLIYEHAVRRSLTGEALAEALEMSPERAKNNAHHVRTVVVRGFTAFALFASGRGECGELDAIVRAAVERDGEVFTQRLREEITRHFDTCPNCGKCQTCGPLQARLVARYAPVLFPLIFAGELRERFQDTLRQIGDSTALPSQPAPGVPRRPQRLPGNGTAEPEGDNATRSLGQRLRLPLAMGIPLLLLLGIALYQHRPTGGRNTPAADSTPSATIAAGPVPPRTVLTRFFVGNNSLAFSRDGKTLATLVSPDQNGSSYSIQLWNTSTGKPGLSFATTGNGVSAVAFSPDGRTVASGAGSDGGNLVFTLRDATTGQVTDTITTITGASGVQEGSSVVYGSDGRLLAMSAAGGDTNTEDTVEVWDATTHSPVTTRPFAGEAIYGVAFGPGDSVLAVGGGDGVTSKGSGRVDLLDPLTGNTTATLHTTGNLVYSLAFSPDGRTLVTSSQTVDSSAPTPGSVQLWDMRTRKATTLTGAARAIAFSSKNVLAVADGSGVELWNITTKTVTATLTMDQAGQAITDLVFSPDGRTLAAESGSTTRLGDEHVSLWDVP
ncbi:hypothetical protein RKE30_21590 [Streptomyces sp. Li-HN-5-11]|uniref:sigma factor n=1 Tax=Streptomyces sp. Li-HN-5-11 TaxID=3075432 RepID=UPI0028B1CC63|nr:sigma factor [Streptomyces sp. Li-HN-5-11]WNM32803.1 hypothetical protein RKE30_21590 [Streptomyces sp. Li-HN-5-11]